MSKYRIADVARLTETNVSTLRLWEKHGLLLPERTDSGQRVYTITDVERVRAIQRMRKVEGLNMSAIRKALVDRSGKPQYPGNKTPENEEATNQFPLGGQFRIARQKAKLSLREAANVTGLPLSLISTFERTSQGASVASLQALASCYGTTVTELSRTSSRSSTVRHVVRAGTERTLPSFGPGITIMQLADSLELLDCQKWILEPNAESDGYYSHEGEEFIHVCQGEFHISIDGEPTYILRQGDSIAFESQRQHAWRTSGNEPTILLWVNTPKSF